MQIALPFAFMLSLLITPIGIAAEPTSSNEGIVAAKTLACRDWDSVTRLYDYLENGDKRRFLIEAHKAVVSGSCSVFESGEAVYISEVGVSSAKLRRRNETVEYWARRRAVEHAHG
jgi:hypothetical protein